MTRNLFNTEITQKSKEEWLTPPFILDALGGFDLDPCAPISRPWDTAAKHYTEKDNGLLQNWEGRVWCNPPYGRETFQWLQRLASHGNGTALIFARTETAGFHDEIWAKADAVFFFKGRLSFHHIDGRKGGSANAASCLVAYGFNNLAAIHTAKERGLLKGKLVRLDNAT